MTSILKGEKPSRPTLFEYFLNDGLHFAFTAYENYDNQDGLGHYRRIIDAFCNLGYDYVTLPGSDFSFHCGVHMPEGASSVSMNSNSIIPDGKALKNTNGRILRKPIIQDWRCCSHTFPKA